MKAWEMELELMKKGKPKPLSEEEQTWDAIELLEKQQDDALRMLWHSNVPGSGAEERVFIGGIQSLENMGMDIREIEEQIPLGIKAYDQNDMVELNRITSIINHMICNAKKDKRSEYWNFKEYGTWEEYCKNVKFSNKIPYNVYSKDYEEKINAGWYAQICGGALGTAIEGFTTDNLREVYGEIREYTRKPNTFNDDITYELAFIKAFERTGYKVTSKDIGLEWVALMPFGWSAEEIALRNMKLGIYPPVSGFLNNPYREWIGAQMRGAICGMAAPGEPYMAAKLAWIDGVISHYNNGVIGEIFNAVLVSLAFVENDIRKIVIDTIEMLPKDSEYYSIVKYALDRCIDEETWEAAWKPCEKRFEKYNWIHAYPNAAAEVIALWFGNGEFDETMHIIAMEGQDVDC
ncbi:MAG: ADP-ribosylglycohydrolase, partial [Clostridiales bacterium]|nr:ADP-ribosylglycohydrolase [Clostridiales bacterium]